LVISTTGTMQSDGMVFPLPLYTPRKTMTLMIPKRKATNIMAA